VASGLFLAVELGSQPWGTGVDQAARRLGYPLLRFWGPIGEDLEFPRPLKLVRVHCAARTVRDAVATTGRLRPLAACNIVVVLEHASDTDDEALRAAGADVIIPCEAATPEVFMRLAATAAPGGAALRVNAAAGRAFLGEQCVALSRTQVRALEVLIGAAGRVLSCIDLVRAAHGYDTSEADSRKLAKVTISRLRRRLRSAGPDAPHIQSVRGYGYTLAPPRRAPVSRPSEQQVAHGE
jgi:DNA-binding response OmpR family regulator